MTRRAKNRCIFSVYIPPSFVKLLELEDAIVRLETKDNGIMIRKISGPTTNSIQSVFKNEERVESYDFDYDEFAKLQTL